VYAQTTYDMNERNKQNYQSVRITHRKKRMHCSQRIYAVYKPVA